MDFPIPHQVDQLGQEAAHRSGATVEVDLGVEQPLGADLDSVRDADLDTSSWTPDCQRKAA